jgi:hypothetical protein
MRKLLLSLGITPVLAGLAVSGALFFGSVGSPPQSASASTCGDLLYGIFYNVGQGNMDYARFLAYLYAENDC